MEHSKHYQKVRTYYLTNLWDEKKVRDAVTNGWITEAEFVEITGKEW